MKTKSSLRKLERDEGDGADVSKLAEEICVKDSPSARRCLFQIDIDLIQVFLFLCALSTRLWRLEHPRAIVFDELHYGRYVSMYMKKTFFFDAHPPLGKMLIALSGFVSGFDGEFNFDRIGSFYLPSVPIWTLRCLPALFGSLVVPLSYQLMIELSFSQWTATVAALLIILDNALLTQSRYILLEGFVLFFMAMSLFSLLRFIKYNKSCQFTIQWWISILMLGVCTTATISTKYIGLATIILCAALVCKEFWFMLPNKLISDRQIIQHFFVRGFMLFTLPAALYTSIFYIHLSILTKAGPHDDVMTSAFQASLDGGLAAITKGQPLEIAYGSQITLRHTFGKPCWLHSHSQVYPLRYSDGRGSSHQQQVTCYTYKDVNNWWIVKHPDRNSFMVDNPIKPVKHGDVVQLIHGITSRALNSHDVAAPVTPVLQEVTCYIDYNISVQAQNLWKVEIVNRDDEGDTWKTIRSQVRLIHVNSSQALKTSGAQLGEWGFYQYEVATDRVVNHESTLWNVEEHRYTRTSDKKETEKDLNQAEMIPLKPVQLGFFSKFWELQLKMLMLNHDAQLEHRYSSGPLDWPLLDTNVAYWMDVQSNAQVHLLGNPLIWISCTASVFVFSGLLVFYLLRRRRKCYDISPAKWEQFTQTGELLLGGYVLHYLPYFLTERTLFLHHYLPAFYFNILLLPALIEHLYHLIRSSALRQVYVMLVLVWLTSVFHTFWIFLPLTYGYPSLSSESIQDLLWKDTWDFITRT